MPGTKEPLPFDHAGCVTSNVALGSRWVTIIDPADTQTPLHGLYLADNGGADITNPEGQIADEYKHPIRRVGRSTTLRLRLKYSSTGGADPVVQVFGRTLKVGESAGTQVWQNVRNVKNALSVTLARNGTNDVQPGGSGDRYTDPDHSEVQWNCEGFDEILVGVKTAMTAGTASLQARMT